MTRVMDVLKNGRYKPHQTLLGCAISTLSGLKLKSIVAVTAERESKGKTTEETRYFISSLDATDPKRLGQVVRAHWGIENNLHWVLDYAFEEDSQRARLGNSAANMAVIRHIALNLIKTEKTAKIGIKNRRLKAGWDDDYLLKMILGSSSLVNDEIKLL